MVSTTAERFSCSLDSDIIQSLATEAARKGQTKSYLVTKYLKDGLTFSSNLTIAEKYRWNMSKIKDILEGLMNSISIKYNGSLVNSILLLYCLPKPFFNSEYEYSLMRQSICNLIDDICKIDIVLGENLLDCLKELNLKIQKGNGNSENSEPDMPGRDSINILYP